MIKIKLNESLQNSNSYGQSLTKVTLGFHYYLFLIFRLKPGLFQIYYQCFGPFVVPRITWVTQRT